MSKYILDKKNLELICNIRDTEDWPFVMDDPMFKTLELDGEFITIKELLAIRAKVYETHRIEREPTPEFVENYDENEGEENLEDNDLRANEADNHLEASYSDGSYERQDDDSRSYTSFHDDQDRPQSPVFDEDAEADRKARASSRQDYSRSPSPASYKVEIDHHDQALNGEQPSDQQDQ